MLRFASFVAVVAVAAGSVGTPASAQDRIREIDGIFSWATPESPGCVVAVSEDGQLVVNRAYGMADLERGVPLTTASVFDAGSVQKQFVAGAVLLLAEEGRLSLSDDVRKHIPELPDYGHRITLNHLLTHTSGIRDWTGMLPMAADDPDVLTLTLRQRGLEFAPGEEWSYSNSGYALLKEIVARTSGMSYAEFVRRRLFEPLGMTATTYQEDLREGDENRAVAYRKQGETWQPDMLLGNARGGGALLTTASDLITWNEALANDRLGGFVSQGLQEQAKLNNGRQLGYARGLYVDVNRGGRFLWHTGGAASYSAILARYPEQGLSISILCNADGEARTAYARRIFDLFVPSTVGAGAVEGAQGGGVVADAPSVDLSGRAGLFFSEEDGRPLRLIVNNGRLGIAGAGPLVPVSNDRFRNPRGVRSFMSEAEFELQFLSPGQIELKTTEGETTRYRRARPSVPTASDLEALAGRYESDEIGAVARVAPGDGALSLHLEHAPEQVLEFRPADDDTFMLGMVTVRFVRDEAGNVVGFDFSNPALRNVRFTRLSEAGTRR